MAKKARLRDVARAANVSVATVSRVATGSARVSPEIVERVRNAARDLEVNLYNGRSLAVLAFLLSNREVLHPFHSQVLIGAESLCAARGWNLLFLTWNYPLNVPWQELHLPKILEHREFVSGVILGGTNSQHLLDLLQHKGLPFAVLGNNVVPDWQAEKYDDVRIDDIQAMLEVTKCLQSLGHCHIWYVGNTRLPWYERRYKAYARAMEEAKLPPRLSEIDSNNSQDIGFLATKAIVIRGEPLSAIVAADDFVAVGVYKALADCGLRVPHDVSVVGFGDLGAATLQPPLTTVRVFIEQLGKRLAELVNNRIEFPSLAPQQFIFPTELVKRESCKQYDKATQPATDTLPQETLSVER
jgi:DNA-binding LacI/PurR family transcriptional regulator